MSTFSRRRFLGTAAGLAAGATLLPPSLHTAMAAPMRRGGLDAIEHVVVLMQENRSFDHYYGTLRGVRGFGDRDPLRIPSGGSIFEQPAPGRGPIRPFSVRAAAAAAGRPGTDIQYIGDLNHDFAGSTAAWRSGWNDGWIAAKTPATMTHYDRADIALQYELADTFTLLDAYHCSVFGSTNPNRNYLWSGTTGFELGTTNRAVTNAAYSYSHPGYDWTTYPERLQAAGVPWQIYQEWDNFTDNAVEYFLPFKAIGRKMLASVERPFRTTEEFYDTVNATAAPADRERLLAQLATGRAALTDAERSLFDRAMSRSEPESLVPRLRADIAAGTLPPVSWLVPSAVDSEHPGTSTPVGSATLMYEVLDALASDPDTWSRTVLLVNFDENDGFFDHVPPPVEPRPASGNSTDWWGGRPIGLGPRVPMTVVSPWTIGGHVDSRLADHTSVLRFLERWTGVREPNISAWRRSVCGDLTSAFDFGRTGHRPRLTVPGPVPAPISRWRPAAPAAGELPAQEPGTRPSRALPYRIVTTVTPAPDGVRLRLAQDGRDTAPVAIYPAGAAEPQHAVLGRYDQVVPASVAVQGPNRFWLHAEGAGTPVEVTLEPRRVTVDLTLRTTGRETVRVLVRDARAGRTRSITVRPGRGTTQPWPTRDGWYDLEITNPVDPTWRRHLTGRVENGRAGRTP